MQRWLHITIIAVSSGFLVLIILLIIKRCFCPKTRKNFSVSDEERNQSLQNGISRLHQVSPDHHDSKKPNYYLFRSTKSPLFNWADHPSLVTDAVENGWSRFAFTIFMSSPSVKSARARLGPCGSRDSEKTENLNVEIGWEVCEGSADFMQKIRLNPELKIGKASTGVVSVIRTSLPLPGPNLANSSSFPQEAYFEITILSCVDENWNELRVCKEKSEGEKIKLITEDFNGRDSSVDVASGHSQRRGKVEEVRTAGKVLEGKNEGVVLLCVGLTWGGNVQLKIPGSYSGSIGFNSSGSVFLDGTKLIFESEKDEWGKPDKVIGCGYNPHQKKVFFTVDSLLVHEIHCQTEEFGSPLYPTLAANTDTMVLVNLGQSPFKYMPANLQRTSNPCFVRPLANSPALGYEDSKELFSMGRIDAQWLQRRSNNNTVNSLRALEYDQESEGDLFEIILDSTGRSPYTITPTYQ